MIFRTVHLIFVMVLSAETLPIPNMNLRPASVNQAEQNFYRPQSGFYPRLHLPVGQSPQITSGHPSSSIRESAVKISDMLNRTKNKFNNFMPSRSTPLSSVYLNQYRGNTHQKTSQKVKQFGQRVRDAVQDHKKRHRERLQHVMGMIEDKFRFEDVKDRMKVTFLNKKSLMNKLHGFGGRRKFVGIPYHTMNDDHMIVKKPGVDFHSVPLANIGTPILPPVPAVQTIAIQHPVVPEVTTSVELHQEWEVPATVDGYVFPITSIASHTPEVTETEGITISIDREKSTTAQLPHQVTSNTTTVSTTMATDYPSEGAILEANTAWPFNETHESAVTEVEMNFTSLDELSAIENEDFGSVTIDPDAITEIASTLFSSPSSTDTILHAETTSLGPEGSRTTIVVDSFSGIQVEPVTNNSVIDSESTTSKIRPTFSPAITIVDDEFASSVIDADTTIGAIISTFSSSLPTDTTLGTDGTLPQELALETNTVAGGISAVINTAFTSPAIDPESTGETISTVLFTVSTENPMVASTMSSTMDESLTIDGKMTTEIVSALPSTISTDTASRPPPVLNLTQLLDVLSSFEYNQLPSLLNEVETTFEVDPTFPPTISTERSTMASERFTTVGPDFNISAIETERTVDNVSIFFAVPSTEITTTLEEISTIAHSGYNSTTSHGETTTEMVSTLPNSISSETTFGSSVALEITQLVDLLSEFGYNPVPSFIDEEETTVRVDSTFLSTAPTEKTTLMTEKLTTVDTAYENSPIETEETTETSSTFSSSFANQTTTTLGELSQNAESVYIDSTLSHGETTTEIVSGLSSEISSETTTDSLVAWEITHLANLLSEFGYYNHVPNFTVEEEKTVGVDSTFISTAPTERASMLTEQLTTVDPAIDNSTIEMKRTTEMITPFFPSFATQTITIFEGISTTADSDTVGPTNHGKTTLGISSTLPSTVSSETSTGSLPPLKMNQIVDLLSEFGYNHVPSSIDEEETTVGVDSTFLSTAPTETTTMVNEQLTTVDPAIDNSTIEMKRTTEIITPFSSSASIETTTTFEEIFTTADSAYDSSASDGKTTTEILSRLPSTILLETTTWAPPASEITQFVDLSSRFGYSHFPSSTDKVETTTGVDSTFPPTIAIGVTTVVTEGSTSVDPAFDNSTIEMKTTTEIFHTKTSPGTTTTSEGTSTTTSSSIASSEIAEGITDEILPTLSSTVPAGETTTPVSEIATLFDVLPEFEYNHFTSSTIGSETTTAVPVIPTETITTVIKGAINVDSTSDRSTIGTEITTEKVSELSLTTSTKASTVSNDVSTTLDPGNDSSTNDEDTPSEIDSGTIFAETISWPVSGLEMTPVVNLIPTFDFNRLPSLRTEVEKTTGVDSTSLPTIPTQTTTISTERLTTFDPASDISTIDTERTTFSTVISSATARTPGEISAITLFDSSLIEEETTEGVISTFSTTFPTDITTTPVSEINTLLEVVAVLGHNHYTGSNFEVDSTAPSTMISIVTERPATQALRNSGFDLDMTTDIDSMFVSTISTEKTTTLKEILTTTSLPFGSSAIPEGTTAEVILTFPPTAPTDNETITSSEEISTATDPASTSSTDDGETTTEIESTLPGTILTETTVVSNRKYDTITEQNFEMLDGYQASDDKRNGRFLNTNPDPTWPRFAHNSEEEPSEKTSVDLIPMIIEYYAKIT